MSAFSWAAQQAVYAVLSGAALAGGRIFDSAPPGVAFPWIEIGDGVSVPEGTNTTSGDSDDGVGETFDLHVWGRGDAGKKQVKQITDSIYDLLDGTSLAIAGRTSANAWVRTMRFLTDPDGITTHAVVSVEIVHRTN